MRCQRTLELCTMLMITGIPQGAGQKSFESGKWRSDPVSWPASRKCRIRRNNLPWNDFFVFFFSSQRRDGIEL